MPANLTPQYMEAEKRYKQASTPEDKIAALEEMLSVIPKHKGTEKLQADIKTRLSKARQEGQKHKGSASKRDQLDVVEREGAGQIVLLGAPNTGKSSLLAHVTKATPEIAEYPFTTHTPLPGMMPYENIKIQLVELPAISPEFWQPRYSGIIRNADAAMLVADLSSADMLDQVETALSLLRESKIELASTAPPRDSSHSVITLHAWLIGNKADLDPGEEAFTILKEFYSDRFELFSISCLTGKEIDHLKQRLYAGLGIIRVYSKPPGKKVDYNDPFVLKMGGTVLDAAAIIHKDFAEKLKFARIWGSERFEGQMVHRDHLLADGDVIEFHI
jgi:ribosome-interacting GTPase 1